MIKEKTFMGDRPLHGKLQTHVCVIVIIDLVLHPKHRRNTCVECS